MCKIDVGRRLGSPSTAWDLLLIRSKTVTRRRVMGGVERGKRPGVNKSLNLRVLVFLRGG